MTLALALARTTREDVSKARDICWQEWQGDRHMMVAEVWLRLPCRQGEGKGMIAADQIKQGEGDVTMASPQR
jgi:hypothetical protein